VQLIKTGSSKAFWESLMEQNRRTVLTLLALAAGVTAFDGAGAWQAARAQAIAQINARVVATNIPGASAISQVGTFLNNSAMCNATIPFPHPIPTLFRSYIQPGAVLDPNRLLVGSQSNFGAPLAIGVGAEGSFLSIDPRGPGTLSVPPNFAQNGVQASALQREQPPLVQRRQQPYCAHSFVHRGEQSPRPVQQQCLWPPLAGERTVWRLRVGSSSILDPTGLPLKGAPNPAIGGVYVGSLTNRDQVLLTPAQSQVIPGSLSTGAVGTAFLGPSPDGTCRAVFSVVTADGAIVQEHTAKGLDGIAPVGTVKPLVGRNWGSPNQSVEPRFGVLMNPYTATPGAAWQLFVSEPFNNTIAVVNLIVFGTAPNQVFGLDLVHPISRISSPSLELPVDLAPVQRDADSVTWASNTTLDEGSDFYVANRGDNTIVRMRQDGTVVGVRRVALDSPVNNASLNGIATSTDGTTIYVTFTIPSNIQGGVLALPAF
jgi:hypothetical protein